MGVTWSQTFPPAPTFTAAEIPSQKGKVFVVTGGYGGVGYHVSSILYNAGGKVYIAGRSEEKAKAAIQQITSTAESASETPTESEAPTDADGKGSLHFLSVDLSDLSTIKECVRQFSTRESQIDVLFNNAGLTLPPVGSQSKQNYELQIATNCLGPFLLTQLLLPYLKKAADNDKSSPGRNISPTRVVWTSSTVVDTMSPTGGLDLVDLTNNPKDPYRNYTNSKMGNYFFASEFSRRIGTESNILSVTVNPGNLKSDLLRHKSTLFRLVIRPVLYPPINGAYTQLFAGLSDELSVQNGNGGDYIIPWGRIHPGMRADILKALLPEGEDGGTGVAAKFWDWCEEEVKPYM